MHFDLSFCVGVKTVLLILIPIFSEFDQVFSARGGIDLHTTVQLAGKAGD